MPFWFEVALAASGAFQWQYRQPWPTSAAGDSFAARADLCHQYSLSPVSLTPAKIFSPVSLIPVIKNQKAWNLSPVSTTPPKKLFSGVNDTGDKFFGFVNDTGD
jgi:hypothetical protein